MQSQIRSLAILCSFVCISLASAEVNVFVPLFPKDGVPAGWDVRAWSDVSKPGPEGAKWTVKDGILNGGGARGSWLVSQAEYSDFELQFEFKLGPQGNSGCALRAPASGDPAFDGLELQMADLRYNTQAKDSELTGGLYRALAPVKQVYKPEQWNRYEITLKGAHVKVVLNGTVIIDNDLDKETALVKRHDGADAPALKDRPRQGRIGFQNLSRGGSAVLIRNARIKVLAPDVSGITGDAEPSFEVWKEDNVYGVLDVALDGTILLFSLQGDPHPDKRRGSSIYLKRSEDGGDTWSEHQLIGKRIDLDWKALGIGPYDGSGWGKDKHHAFATLCTTVVDENTGEIMFFLGALYPAPYMYKSRDHGKTWHLEKIKFRKDSRGFLSVPNAACDPGITIRHGPHKGRLLVPSRVMPNYNKHEEAKGYTSAVYSDDHGKTWINSEPFPLDGTGESGLVELSDGTIYFNSRTHTRKGNRWIAYSDDSGETWRGLHQDKVLFDGPPDEYGCKAGLLRLDRDDADILLFSSPTAHLPGRRNIRVWVSFDGGRTWPHNRLIRRGPGNYTWMTEGRKGTPGEGFIYLLSGKDWMARFNMAWLLQPDHGPARLEGDYRGHVQGIAADGRGNLFWSHTYSIIKTDNEGKVQLKVQVPGHAGDICHLDGKLYCAFNFGEFNQEPGKADSWVWVFDAESLKVLEKHEVSQVVHGAGGITHHDGHFYVVGGLPESHQRNYVYQYDPGFKFVKRHVLNSGHTHLGIQTAAFAHGSFWFGCYGDPPQLLKSDPQLQSVERFQFDASFGIEALHDGGLLVCPNNGPASRRVRVAEPSDKTGLGLVPDQVAAGAGP